MIVDPTLFAVVLENLAEESVDFGSPMMSIGTPVPTVWLFLSFGLTELLDVNTVPTLHVPVIPTSDHVKGQ